MSDALPTPPIVSAPPRPDDISATLAPGLWAILRGDDVVDVWDRDPDGRLFPGLDAVDARGTPDVAAGWRRAGGRLVAPDAPAPTPDPAPARVVSAPEFLALFTPDEAAAMWAADPALMFGAMLVLAQGTANLDSPDLANLLGLAVAKGVLTRARAERVAAGLPPGPPDPTAGPA